MSMIIISKYFCLHAIGLNDSLDWILPSWNIWVIFPNFEMCCEKNIAHYLGLQNDMDYLK